MSADRGERLRKAFETGDSQGLWPNQRPRDAATLIILDRTGTAPKVLMGRRHAGHKFMPGKFVFPGGRIETGDRRMPSVSELRPTVAARLAARVSVRSDGRERALALTAIRETYEETGLLLGRRVEGARPPPPSLPAWQPFAAAGILPDLAALTFLGRAITPPRRPKRFDTRFFAVDRSAIAAERSGFIGPDKELVELCWVGLDEASALDLPRITSIMLEELGHRMTEGLESDSPIPFYREDRGRFLRHLL